VRPLGSTAAAGVRPRGQHADVQDPGAPRREAGHHVGGPAAALVQEEPASSHPARLLHDRAVRQGCAALLTMRCTLDQGWLLSATSLTTGICCAEVEFVVASQPPPSEQPAPQRSPLMARCTADSICTQCDSKTTTALKLDKGPDHELSKLMLQPGHDAPDQTSILWEGSFCGVDPTPAYIEQRPRCCSSPGSACW
jgi:hypothetical protein